MLRRRLRRKWSPPAEDKDPDAGHNEARRAVADAVQRLNIVLSRQSEVDEYAAKLERVNRENHLVPRITRALGAHSDC